MKLTFETNKNFEDWKGRIHKDVFIIDSTFKEKDIVKSAGFWWNPKAKTWYTPYKKVAAALADFAVDENLKSELLADRKEKEDTLESSRAADAVIDIPSNDGLNYLPFQKAGVAYGLNKESVLFGDEMGLGKTIETIGVINADPTMKKILIVCPASLKLNWKAELEKWLVRDFTIHVHKSINEWNSDADIVIINYDIMKKFHNEIHSTFWDMIIADECHYLKNPKAKRTKEIVGEYFNFKKMTTTEINEVLEKFNVEKSNDWGMQLGELVARRKLFLTGTPIPNKVIEIWPIVHYLAPKEFYNFVGFAKRYCGAGSNGYGWDLSGATNLEELQEKLRLSVMIRRLKKDVLKELPPKYRQVIEMSLTGKRAEIVNNEIEFMEELELRLTELKVKVELAKISDNPEDYGEAVANLRKATMVAFDDMSRVRHETALAKVPDVIKFLEDATENHKVVVFAHHRDVIEKIHESFGDHAVKLYGGMSEEKKKEAEDRFNNDPNITLFVGSIKAAGVGLNLQVASHVVFAELDWVPGNITQAEDRTHRIGQTKNVLCQHLVLEGSLDAHMAKKLVAKQDVIDRVLDEKVEIKKVKYFITPGDDASTKNAKKSSIEKVADKLNIDQKAAIHDALKRLSSMCDGANAEDFKGFNRVDTRIGKSLAAAYELTPKQAALGYVIVLKYHGQLGDDMIDRIKNTRLLEDNLFKIEL